MVFNKVIFWLYFFHVYMKNIFALTEKKYGNIAKDWLSITKYFMGIVVIFKK